MSGKRQGPDHPDHVCVCRPQIMKYRFYLTVVGSYRKILSKERRYWLLCGAGALKKKKGNQLGGFWGG